MRIIDITRAGRNAVHVHIEVPRSDLLGSLLGLRRVDHYLGVSSTWYDPTGNRISDIRKLTILENARSKWDEGRYPVILWD